MTAALLITYEISRRIRGKCKPYKKGLLAADGFFHADCSTCFATCGDMDDMGLAFSGVVITQDWNGLNLKWKCPGCGCDTYQETVLMSAARDAEQIAADSLCCKCRKAT